MKMKYLVWDGEKGSNYTENDIPADMLDQAKEYREKIAAFESEKGKK